MPPAEKHILEIDSAELAFGERRILSGVYLLVETGGVTAVLGRNGCGKSCLMKILSGSLKAGFCSMRIDGKWHRRFTERRFATFRSIRSFPDGCGWNARSAISGCKGKTWNGGFRSSFPCAEPASGSCRAGNSGFWNVSSSCAARPGSSCSTSRSRRLHPCTLQRSKHSSGRKRPRKGFCSPTTCTAT
ncbi:MAG: ATP-binding cassette domain-containing protein [Alistipes shahii]